MSEPATPRAPLISILIPMLNEAEGIGALERRLVPALDALGVAWEAVLVDDGSRDATLERIKALHARDARFKAVSLSRNFGKEIAIAAGLRYVRGDAAIIMDADLQHPPEVLAQFLARWREGYHVVYGQRMDRETDGPLRRALSRVFYRVYAWLARTSLPQGAGDFRLLDRKAIDAMNRIRETSRFNKGLFHWIGFRSIGVPFDVSERAHGGSRFNWRQLARFAIDGLTSFSTLPLRVWSLVGLVVSLSAFAYAFLILARTVLLGRDVPGFATIVVSVMFFAGVQLLSLGVLGEYLGRVYEEVKARPLFLVAEEVGLEGEAPAAARTPQRAPVKA